MRSAHRVMLLALAWSALMLGGCAREVRPEPDAMDGLRSGALFDELARLDSILFDAS